MHDEANCKAWYSGVGHEAVVQGVAWHVEAIGMAQGDGVGNKMNHRWGARCWCRAHDSKN